MAIGTMFWILMLLCLVFGFYAGYNSRTAAGYPLVAGHNIMVWVLLALLGWAKFGSPLHP